jgi:hypothetical protein
MIEEIFLVVNEKMLRSPPCACCFAARRAIRYTRQTSLRTSGREYGLRIIRAWLLIQSATGRAHKAWAAVIFQER